MKVTAVNQAFKQVLKQVPNIHRPDGRPNVFLFSTPRSGSTWLMELIWSQPGFKYCAEPLNLRNPGVRQHLGVGEWRQLYSNDAIPLLHDYFQAFCEGRLRFKNPNPFKGYFRPVTHRIVFKEIHAGGAIINWFRDNFNARVVVLLRHPLAVSLSREELPTLTTFIDSDYQHHFSAEQLEYSQRIVNSGTRLERGVLAWCLQNAVPLRDATDDWAIISYEQMVLAPLPLVGYLADKLQLPLPDRMMNRLTVPSGVKAKSDKPTQDLLAEGDSTKRPWLVEKWRRKVDDAEERAAMAILERFEIDAYRFGDPLPAGWLWVR